MERRVAVKNMLFALGATVSASTVLSIFGSCTEDAKTGWVSTFYDPSEIKVVHNLVDIYLPKTSIVGGKDLNLAQFVDMMSESVLDEEKQAEVKLGSKVFIARFEEEFDKNIANGSKEDFEAFIALYMNVPKDKEDKVFQLLDTPDYKLLPKSEQQDYLLYTFLTTVRTYSFLGFYTSEIVEDKIMELT
ncbi:gluconate 2-dehydrogenase subunit 3 family protein [Formosa sp. 3Alg 14/1]|uniref:gluconate 2-dehydrogenase subunit 3 family protein n=1 Tax=Formosa sp. 3Alg 14/1 TaxID=3382190 RepID=UPI0039BECD0B